MTQHPTPRPAYWTAPGWLIQQSHSEPWTLRAFLNNNTLWDPPASPLFSSPLPHRRHQQVISDLTLKRRKTPSSSKHYDYDYGHICRKTVPKQGSVHIQPLCGRLLTSKGCFSELVKKRAGEGVAAFEWREINEVIFQGLEGLFIITPLNMVSTDSSPAQHTRPRESLMPLSLSGYFI